MLYACVPRCNGVDVSGLKIADRRLGHGEPLLLHGGFSDSREWRAQLAGPSDGFDDPGRGLRGLGRLPVAGRGRPARAVGHRHPRPAVDDWGPEFLATVYGDAAPPAVLEEAMEIPRDLRPAGFRPVTAAFLRRRPARRRAPDQPPHPVAVRRAGRAFTAARRERPARTDRQFTSGGGARGWAWHQRRGAGGVQRRSTGVPVELVG